MLFSLNGLSTNPDSGSHLNAALDIINHKPINQISEKHFKREPLFSIFIASSFWLFGISIRNAFWLIRLFFLLNVMSVFFIGNKLFNRWVGLIASLFLLTSLTFHKWSSYLLIANILPFFLVWYFYFSFLGMEKRSPKYFIFASIFLTPSLFLKEYTIIFLPVLFLMIFTSVFIKGYSTKKLFKLLITVGIVLLIIYISWASVTYLSSGHIFVSPKQAKNLRYIEISPILSKIKFILTDKNGNFSLFNFVRNLYFFYIRFISPNFPILIEFLLLFGWGFTLYKAFLGSKLDILLSIFFLISLFIMVYMGHPKSDWSFRIIFFFLCFSSLVISRLIYEIIKKILLTFKKIEFLKPKFISSLFVILIISLVFGTQISQSWAFYRTRVSLFSGNWKFTVHSFHNSAVKNMSAWISDNIPENSKILSSIWWGESFYFFTKGKYPLNLLKLTSKKDFNSFFKKDKLLFLDHRKYFFNRNFHAISEKDLLKSLKRTAAQYILITSPDNSLLPYLNDNDCFEKLHEIQMYPNPGWITLYKVLDIKPKVGYQGVINRAIMNRLKNLYKTDKNRFYEIKERILKKGLRWSDEDIGRRIIRDIPSHLVNLRMNDKVEFVGYDLTPIIQSKFEIIENEENENRNEQDEIATLLSIARNDDKLVSFEKVEGKGKKGLTQEISLLKIGEKFELIFYWKCLKKIEHNYAVWASFTEGYKGILDLGHVLVDEAEYPPIQWKPGEVVKEIRQFRVPDDVYPGEYEFKMSLYDIIEGKEVTPFSSVGKVKIIAL